MIIGRVIISFPVKSFESKVTVISPRKPTVIEHQILQSIKSLSKTAAWKNKGIYDLFEKLFMVPNPNSFVSPVLIELKRLNVINFEEPDSSNHEVAVGNITITNDGLEMMKKGELPSSEREEISTDKFDLITNSVLLSKGSVKQIAESHKIEHDQFENQYPKEIISDSLMNRTIDWLKKGITIIRNVEQLEVKDSWINETCIINISKERNVSLSCLNKDYQKYLENHEILKEIIDEKFRNDRNTSLSVNDSTDIQSIEETAFNFKPVSEGVQFITQQFGDVALFNSIITEFGDYNTTVVFNSNSDKVESKNNKFIIYTKNNMPIDGGCEFMDQNNNVFINNFDICINGDADVIPLSYSIKSIDKTIDEILKDSQIYFSKFPPDVVELFKGDNGKNIKDLMEKYHCKIIINDEGKCLITGLRDEHVEKVIGYIQLYSIKPAIDEVYEGKVISIDEKNGANIRISPLIEGLIPISELSLEKVKDINDFVTVGKKVKVILIKIDKGKYHFSIKALTEKQKMKQKKSKINDKSKSNKNTGEKTNTEKVKVKTNLFN